MSSSTAGGSADAAMPGVECQGVLQRDAKIRVYVKSVMGGTW